MINDRTLALNPGTRDAKVGAHRIREYACWAHVRRKYFDLFEATNSPIAKKSLDRIGALYGIESDIRGNEVLPWKVAGQLPSLQAAA